MWQAARRCLRFWRPGIGIATAIFACVGTTESLAAQGRAGDRIVGSLSSAGAVSLRGVRVSDEATVFEGDRIQTSGESWVTVSLADGSRLELAGNTDVQVGREPSGVRVAMRRGQLAVTSPRQDTPVRVDVESLEVFAPGGAAAEIAFLEPGRVRVTALREAVSLSRQDGQETETVQEGDQRIINLDAGVTTENPEQDDEEGSSSKKWVFLGAGIGGGTGVAILVSGSEASPSQP